MSSFRPLSDTELRGRTDEGVIAYVNGARSASDLDALRQGVGMLVEGYMPQLLVRAKMKLPARLAEDIAQEALFSALQSAFDGTVIPQFRKWIHTILSRRIADHYRKDENAPMLVPLITDAERDEETWGSEPATEAEGPEIIHLREVVEECFGELNPAHQEVVELFVFGRMTAAEVVEQIDGMTEDNVHQIASRFRRCLRQRLDEGDTGG